MTCIVTPIPLLTIVCWTWSCNINMNCIWSTCRRNAKALSGFSNALSTFRNWVALCNPPETSHLTPLQSPVLTHGSIKERIIKDPHWNCGLFIFCVNHGVPVQWCANTNPGSCCTKAALSAGGETACDINKTRSFLWLSIAFI